MLCFLAFLGSIVVHRLVVKLTERQGGREETHRERKRKNGSDRRRGKGKGAVGEGEGQRATQIDRASVCGMDVVVVM